MGVAHQKYNYFVSNKANFLELAFIYICEAVQFFQVYKLLKAHHGMHPTKYMDQKHMRSSSQMGTNPPPGSKSQPHSPERFVLHLRQRGASTGPKSRAPGSPFNASTALQCRVTAVQINANKLAAGGWPDWPPGDCWLEFWSMPPPVVLRPIPCKKVQSNRQGQNLPF